MSSTQLGEIIEAYYRVYTIDMRDERMEGVEDGVGSIDQEMEGERGIGGEEIEEEGNEGGGQVEGGRSYDDVGQGCIDEIDEPNDGRFSSGVGLVLGEVIGRGRKNEDMGDDDLAHDSSPHIPSCTETLLPGGTHQNKCVVEMEELLEVSNW